MKSISLALSASAAALLWIPTMGQKPAAATYTFEFPKGANASELEVALKELGVAFQGASTDSIQLEGESGSSDGDGIHVFQVQSAKQGGQGAAQGRGYLGITYEPVDGAIRIAEMMPGSGAAEAGLRVGDRITRIGKFYYGNDDFEAGLNALVAGESVEVRAVRGDSVLELQVVLRTLEAVQGQAPTGPKPPIAEQEVRLRLTPVAPKAKAASPATGEWAVEADEEDCSCCPCCTLCENKKDPSAEVDLSEGSEQAELASPRVMLGRRLEQPSIIDGLAKVRILRKALKAPEQDAGASGGMQALVDELQLLRKEMAGLRKDLAAMRKSMAVAQAKQASAGTPQAASKNAGGDAKKAKTGRNAKASKRQNTKRDRRTKPKTRQTRARKRRTRR